jgi:hypothetical protein
MAGFLFIGVLFVLLMMLTAPIWVGPFVTALNSITGGGAGPGGGGTGGSPTPTATISAPGTGGVIPVISARDYVGGSAPLTVSGSFGINSTIGLDPQSSFSDGVETTLSYGFNDESGGVLLAFSHAEGSEGLGLNVNFGSWMATYMGEGCAWDVNVTEQTLAGHVSCSDLPAMNAADGTTGTVDVELDFTADSPP